MGHKWIRGWTAFLWTKLHTSISGTPEKFFKNISKLKNFPSFFQFLQHFSGIIQNFTFYFCNHHLCFFLNNYFELHSASHKFWDCASKIETSGSIVIKIWEVVTSTLLYRQTKFEVNLSICGSIRAFCNFVCSVLVLLITMGKNLKNVPR